MHSQQACQDFDLMVEAFSIWVEERQNRMHEVVVPEKPKGAPQTTMVHTFRTTAEVLGFSKVEDRTDGTAPEPTEDSLSAYEAGLLHRLETDSTTAEDLGGIVDL